MCIKDVGKIAKNRLILIIKHEILVLLFMAINVSVASIHYYVAPTGSDFNPGTIEAPFKTLQKARNVIRTINSNMTEDIVVNIRAGRYEISNTLVFSGLDSASNGHQIIYKAYMNEVVQLSGGKQVTGWTQVPGKPYYVADVPEHNGYADYFRQIYVDGKRAVLASKSTPVHGLSWWDDPITPETIDGIVFSGSQVADCQVNIEDIRLFQPANFKADYMPVIAIYPSGSNYIFQMLQPFAQIRYDRGGGMFDLENNWYIQNAFEELDSPGEWYLNRVTDKVYYYPYPWQNMLVVEVYAPLVDPVIHLHGTAANKVRNLRFEGLLIEHGNWFYPRDYHIGGSQAEGLYAPDSVVGAVQYDYEVTGQIILDQTSNIEFVNNVFRHSANCGIHVYNGAVNTLIEGNITYDTTAAGIAVGRMQELWEGIDNDIPDEEQSSGTVIRNNYVTDTGSDYIQATGISLMTPLNCQVLNNVVCETTYMGIHQRSGETGPPQSWVGNTEIGFNEVYHANLSVLVDNGAIYSFGLCPGTHVHHNWIHDEQTLCAYYNDNKSHQVTIEWNVAENFYNMRSAYVLNPPYENWLLNNYTRSDITRNNYCVVENLHTGITGDWPVEAQNIIDNAGLQPAYQHLIDKYNDLVATRDVVVACFDDGNGATLPDQFPGSVGLGWAEGWSSSGDIAASVFSSNPLNDGGNYLFLSGIDTMECVKRKFGSDEFNTAATYMIFFDVRIDSSLPDLSSGRIQFFSNSDGTAATSSTASWIIFGSSNSSLGLGNSGIPTWGFHYGTKDGSFNGDDAGEPDMENSQIEIIPGHTYRFVVEVKPSILEYRVVVDDLDDLEAAYTSSYLGFRRTDNIADPYLVFGAQNASAPSMSLDSIIISEGSLYSGDLTFDGKVNLEDVAELGQGWQSIYNMDELTNLAVDWLKGSF